MLSIDIGGVNASQKFAKALADQGYVGEDVGIAIDFVEEIPVRRSGKRRFVISKFAEEHF